MTTTVTIGAERVALGPQLKARPNIGVTLRHAAGVCERAAQGLPHEFPNFRGETPIPVANPTPEMREAFAERAQLFRAAANRLQGPG